MNKKFLLALALPAVMVGCSQEDLVSENVATTKPEAKSISGLTFNITKNGSDVESRAIWTDANKIKFEKSDKVSLFWLGADGLTQKDTDGTFISGTPDALAASLIGKSNAVYRTEDGSSFNAEAVVYEGYNHLVYPADVNHTTNKEIKVGLPKVQDASEDFTKHVIYVGDSLLQIHQPSYHIAKGKYYDMYGHEASTDDPNTSGYAHGIKTGVKLLTSILDMELRIKNAPANDVKITKVVLADRNNGNGFNQWGHLSAGAQNTAAYKAKTGSKADYVNPWFTPVADGYAKEVVLDMSKVPTVLNGTKATMLLMPANIGSTAPVLKVYTNYGVVTIGGEVAVNDAHTNCIYKKDGFTYAAADDKQALLDIALNTKQYAVTQKLYNCETKKNDAEYTFTSGVYMKRVINVDMQKAEISGQHVKNTAELNAILKSAVTNTNKVFTSSNQLEIVLDHNNKGEFELTNYEGLEAFVKKYGEGALVLNTAAGLDYEKNTAAFSHIVLNTTTDNVLKKIEGLAINTNITIPATSAINIVKNGNDTDGVYDVEYLITNETTITVPAMAKLKVYNNKKGTIVYTYGAYLNFLNLSAANWGTVYYEAKTKTQFDTAVNMGVNYVKVDGLATTFFSEGIDVTTGSTWTQLNTGVTVEFSNCGKLNETVEGTIKAKTIVLSNGTSYPNLTSATVDKIVVKSATAELGVPATATAKAITAIEIAEGTTAINNLDIANLTVKAGATANMDKKTAAPSSTFFVFGTASFTGSNRQTDEKVFVDANNNGKIDAINAIPGQCLVTGTLNLSNNLAYAKVAVDENTTITVAEGVKGLGYTSKIFVTKDAQAKNTANLKFLEDNNYTSSKISWNGNFTDIAW